MNAFPSSDLSPDAILSELAALGMRAARVVVRMMELEQAVVDVAAQELPRVGVEPGSLAEALAGGQAVDGLAVTLAQVSPRVEALARALERVSRSVRRSLALRARMAAGWPRVGRDDRAGMVRRQVARGVGEAIRRCADGEAAERLFDELAVRLEDPALDDALDAGPVEDVVRSICLELGLAVEAVRSEATGVKRTTVLLRGSGQSPELSSDGGAVDTC